MFVIYDFRRPALLAQGSSQEEKIKFPVKWKLDDLYHFPFVQGIISEYGKTLAENDYKGIYKPNSILPYPKDIIKKAIYYMFDYLNYDKALYDIKNKDKYAENLDGINVYLYISFIETGNNDLPKEGRENHQSGKVFHDKQEEINEVDELDLIDWLNEPQWIIKGVGNIDNEQYDFGEKCLNKALEINPNSKDAKAALGLCYLHIAEDYAEKDDRDLEEKYLKKAAELDIKEATKKLELRK